MRAPTRKSRRSCHRPGGEYPSPANHRSSVSTPNTDERMAKPSWRPCTKSSRSSRPRKRLTRLSRFGRSYLRRSRALGSVPSASVWIVDSSTRPDTARAFSRSGRPKSPSNQSVAPQKVSSSMRRLLSSRLCSTGVPSRQSSRRDGSVALAGGGASDAAVAGSCRPAQPLATTADRSRKASASSRMHLHPGDISVHPASYMQDGCQSACHADHDEGDVVPLLPVTAPGRDPREEPLDELDGGHAGRGAEDLGQPLVAER